MSKQFRIDKGIPVPTEDNRRNGKYPWRQMSVGDSIFVEGQSPGDSAGASARGWAKRHGGRFVTRKVDGGTRIWRVE